MTKSELITALAEKAGTSKTDAEKVLNAFTETVTEVMLTGDKLSLVGFGSFEGVLKPESTAINPRTKETVVVPAHRVPKFKAGKKLKDDINTNR